MYAEKNSKWPMLIDVLNSLSAWGEKVLKMGIYHLRVYVA